MIAFEGKRKLSDQGKMSRSVENPISMEMKKGDTRLVRKGRDRRVSELGHGRSRNIFPLPRQQHRVLVHLHFYLEM